MNFSRISAKVDDPKVGQGEIFLLRDICENLCKKTKFDAANSHFEKVAKYHKIFPNVKKKMYALNLLLLIQMLSNNKKKVMRGVKMYLWD